jgi:hypothetical protein
MRRASTIVGYDTGWGYMPKEYRPMPYRHRILVLLSAVLLVLATLVAACGGDDDENASATATDRAFAAEMIGHHEGAIRMARLELAEGKDPEMRTLAKAIIAAQATEIEQMNAWRRDWYGAASPAGGVPDPRQGSARSDDEQQHGMDHSG